MFRLTPSDISAPIDLAEVLARPAIQSFELDHQFYIVFERHDGGYVMRERDVSHMGRAATIRDIISGEFSNIAAIVEFNAVEGTSRPAIEDIAISVADQVGQEGEPISPELHAFIEDYAGLDHARGLRTFDRSFAA